MPRMTMIEAIRDAMHVTMAQDPNVVVFGEDVGYFCGVFRCTQGLQQKFGRSRCFDAPINESWIIGAAVCMAAYGLRPCVEIQFADYVYPGYDQIVSEAARLRYRSNGDFIAPLTIRMPTGGGPLLMRCLLKRAMLRKVGCNAAGRFGAEDGQPRSIAWNPAHASLHAIP